MASPNHTCPKCGSTSMIYTDPMYCSKCNHRMPGNSIKVRSSPNPDRMEPGPELDRLVAEALLNYRGPDQPPTCMGVIVAGRQPSTNIAHAWEVVERMKAPDFTLLRYSADPIGDPGKRRWCANFNAQSINDVADTAPHAICLAALRAMA